MGAHGRSCAAVYFDGGGVGNDNSSSNNNNKPNAVTATPWPLARGGEYACFCMWSFYCIP
jgi:hypothetical protein